MATLRRMAGVEHYDELGVAPTATPAEIRTSYLALARRYHPDRLIGVPTDERNRAAARMARINEAWTVLSDRDRRARYDAQRGGAGPTSATVRDAGETWIPYGDDDDAVDPRLLDDTPTGARTVHRSLTFLPAALAAAGAVVLLFGFILNLAPLLATGLLLEVAAGLAFLVIPLLALARSSRADRLP